MQAVSLSVTVAAEARAGRRRARVEVVFIVRLAGWLWVVD